jgi:hypothetical protein
MICRMNTKNPECIIVFAIYVRIENVQNRDQIKISIWILQFFQMEIDKNIKIERNEVKMWYTYFGQHSRLIFWILPLVMSESSNLGTRSSCLHALLKIVQHMQSDYIEFLSGNAHSKQIWWYRVLCIELRLFHCHDSRARTLQITLFWLSWKVEPFAHISLDCPKTEEGKLVMAGGWPSITAFKLFVSNWGERQVLKQYYIFFTIRK